MRELLLLQLELVNTLVSCQCGTPTVFTVLNGHYLHQEGVLCHGTEVNLAADFYSCSGQTFLRKTTQEQSLILVHIGLIRGKLRN